QPRRQSKSRASRIEIKELLTTPRHTTEQLLPPPNGRPMEILVTSALLYIAIGAAFFAHPASPATPDDFHWRSQVGVVRAPLPDVLAWPLTLWRFARTYL